MIKGSDMNKTIHGKLITDIKSILTGKENIEGLLLLGSVAKGDFTFYSDVDLAVIGNQEKVIKVLEDLVTELKTIVHHYFVLKPNLFIMYIDEPLRKIEFHIYPSVDNNEFLKIFKSSKSYDIGNIILIDNIGDIRETFEKIIDRKASDSQDMINEIANRFINYLESSIYYHGRGDTYRSYFLYNLAVHQLSKLHSLEKGQASYLYNPSFVFLAIDEIDRSRYADISGTFNPMDMRDKFWKLFIFFSDTIKRIKEKFRIKVDLDGLTKIIKMSQAREKYFNFRDIATIPNQIKPVIRENVIYRSSTLSKYRENDDLKQFIEERDIRTIIDIRGKEESLKHPYDRVTRQMVRIMHFPLEIIVNNPEREVFEGLDEIEIFYLSVLIDHGEIVGEIVRLLSEEKTGTAVIHCLAGKDRTGIIVTIILELLGIQRNYIEFDYLSSSGRVNKDTLRVIFDEIDRRKGIESYMSDLDISKDIICRLKKRLLLEGQNNDGK